MEAEGWYHDPYGLHEERWYSDGTPTRLVRDAGAESYDPPPPEAAPDTALVRSAGEPSATAGPDDLRRADDAEREDMNPDYGKQAFETFGLTQAGWDPYDEPDRRR